MGELPGSFLFDTFNDKVEGVLFGRKRRSLNLFKRKEK